MKESDKYETPPEVFQYWNSIFNFDLDVCAEKSTAKCESFIAPPRDALAINWAGMGERAWMNPPYSNPKPWVKAAQEHRQSGVLTVALLPADTSTGWYQTMKADPQVTLLHPPGRIRFLLNGVRQGSPKFGNVIAIFWPEMKRVEHG